MDSAKQRQFAAAYTFLEKFIKRALQKKSFLQAFDNPTYPEHPTSYLEYDLSDSLDKVTVLSEAEESILRLVEKAAETPNY